MEVINDLDSVKCAVCLDIFTRPYKIKCGHTLCHNCLTTLDRTSGGKSKCPECMAPFSVSHTRPDVEKESFIASHSTACDGCSKKFPLKKFKSHCEECPDLAKKLASKDVKRPQISPAVKLGPNRSTFTCPYCDTRNLDLEALRTHCNQRHNHDRKSVVCPVCMSMPWGDPNQQSSNFLHHINNRHKFDYETYVDYSEDEDETLRKVLQQSMLDN